MSRWLWALLGGVVLVAIAAVFWIASQPDECHTPRFARPSACRSRAGSGGAACSCAGRPATSALVGSRPYCAGSRALASPPSPPAAHEAAAPLAPAPTAPPAPTPAPAPDALGSARRRAGAPTSACSRRPARRSAPAAARARTGDAGSPRRIRAQEPRAAGRGLGLFPEDCNRLFERRGGGWAYRQPVDKFAQAAIVEPKRILLPSASCRVEGASEADGALKVSAECADSITYTTRSVMITLRSPTELLYSASGDPVLATTLNKCARKGKAWRALFVRGASGRLRSLSAARCVRASANCRRPKGARALSPKKK